MKITITAHPARISPERTIQITFSKTIVSETVECSNGIEFDAALKRFVRALRETGQPAAVCFGRDRSDGARAFAGFKQLNRGPYYCNLTPADGRREVGVA